MRTVAHNRIPVPRSEWAGKKPDSVLDKQVANLCNRLQKLSFLTICNMPPTIVGSLALGQFRCGRDDWKVGFDMLVRRFMTLLSLLLFGTAAFAQNVVHPVPEGGSDLAYLAVAGASCLGAIVYRFRR